MLSSVRRCCRRERERRPFSDKVGRMSEFKGVEVIGNNNTDPNFKIGKHEDGTMIAIADSHLIVKNSSAGIVAIYAPGKWNRASVVGL